MRIAGMGHEVHFICVERPVRLLGDEMVESTLHFAELGVILLLFIIGLELQPSRLWALRRAVFGLGAVQVLASGALIGLIAYAFGLGPAAALLVGLTLALSSTAFALQTLAEKGQLTARHGRSAFAILLFQDLAVVPLLALVPFLGDAGPEQSATSPWVATAQVVGVVVGTVVVGRFLLAHAFRIVARTRIREIFTALALLTVIGTALLMDAVGLSMALGAFLAGVLLADSEFRHALEADIEPFKGLLLGLFFMAVGMAVNLGLLVEEPLLIVGLALGLTGLKFALLLALGLATRQGLPTSLRLAASIAQGGEFAFVIFGQAVMAGVLEPGLVERLIVVVTLSMAITPLAFLLTERALARRRTGEAREFDSLPDDTAPVIIAGFGRFGQIVGRILRAKRIPFTALDASSEHVDFVRRYGNRIYYGDASRLELLEAAGAGRASLLVLAIDDVEASLRTARTVREHFPKLRVYARARNRKHAYQLMDLGITTIRRETFGSSLEMADLVLQALGLPAKQSRRIVQTFREHDVKRLMESHASHGDEERMRYLARQFASELEEIFADDEAESGLAG